MKIAMIGCGDVGQCYGRAFHQQGMNISDVFDIATTKEVSQLAESLNAQLHSEPGTWLAKADVVISAVFGAVAMQTFEKVAPYMKSNAIFADLTTAPVQDLNKAARQAQLHGVRFVDVALMGTVSLSGHRTPLFMAGQGGQALADLFQQIQAPVTVMDSPAGSAIALKLLRSVYTKGLEALAVECLIAAEKQGLTNDLFAALADLEKVKNSELMKTMVQTHVYHAQRRLLEVLESKALVQKNGVQPLVTEGVEQRFAYTSAQLETTPYVDQDGFSHSLKWLAKTEKEI